MTTIELNRAYRLVEESTNHYRIYTKVGDEWIGYFADKPAIHVPADKLEMAVQQLTKKFALRS